MTKATTAEDRYTALLADLRDRAPELTTELLELDAIVGERLTAERRWTLERTRQTAADPIGTLEGLLHL